MNIAIFTDSFLPGVGGTENAVLGFADALVESGNNVLVCCPKFNRQYKDSFKFNVVRAKSIKVTKNDCFAFPNLSKNVKKQLDSFKPDIVHIQTVSPMAGYGIKYAKKHNLPLVSTVHTKFKTAFSHSIKSKFIVNMLIKDLVKKINKCDKTFTVSNDMILELNSYGYNNNITVIRNGANFTRVTDIDKLKPLALKEYNLQEENILLYVGRIIKFKNLEFILNALSLVKEKVPNFKMLFVGNGPDEEYFKKLTKNLNLTNNVIFTGVITDKKQLSSIYSIADLYVFPSIFDNDSLTIIEASLHKVPSIAIKDTGSSERITNDVSGFITNNDVTEYANKIIELLSNKQKLKQVGEKAEKLIPKDWLTTANEYL